MDQIDLKILQLLQKRTKLSTRIGEVKRLYHAPVFVPERERDLLARVVKRSKGKLSSRGVTAIYREILSSSRAAQGQAPVGVLRSSAETVIPPGRWCLGACDEFQVKKTWAELAEGLQTGGMALALLTGEDLVGALQTAKDRNQFLEHFTIVGDIAPGLEVKVSLAERIFLVTPRGKGASCRASRILILIECKSTVNAVKTLLSSMPDRPIDAESLTFQARPARSGSGALVRLSLPQLIDGISATGGLLTACKSASIAVSILGVYPGTENYGG